MYVGGLMASYVEITPKPKRFGAQFIRAGAVLKDLRAPLEQSVRRVIIPSMQKNFFEGGRPSWEPLASETLQRRAREDSGDTILHVTGRGESAALSRARWSIGMRQAS